MGSLPALNHGVNYLLCVIDVFTNYDKKSKTVLYGFIEANQISCELIKKINFVFLCKNS